ncbi:alginate lyase family protein [Streptomyces sp. ME02-6979-3A]|uniref:alginate lyase family protein n=1 Tax=unclassified Streptomyces TaxID=2593676 RepID=UPI0029B4BC66|nr:MULTISPECIES: alginate lyase family protein [unclassified Streptomyces]MDX3329878.1 alginate lyase family protein [Streptomyces sp. ME02-6979-3A]MDX3432899.1 alginate lyase family protein [Streptomyces sp. ME01-18a]
MSRIGASHRTRRRPALLLTAAAATAALVAGILSLPGTQHAEAAPAAFAHPGVTVSKGQLDFTRGKVNAGAQPWKGAYDQMMASKYADQNRTAKPRATVECGSYSNPNYGCTDEREDAIAAYTNALAWYITRDERYAKKSIELMDAWSAVIKDHTNSNAPLQTGWAGSSWPKAAEIIKHTYTGTWSNSDRFATMLRDVYLPKIINGSNSNGNWELSMMEAAVGISVFLDDKTSYDKAMAKFRTRTAAYVYLASDGAVPRTVPSQNLDTTAKIVNYWQGQSTFVTGLTQETCRDFTHTGYGISAIAHIAETSRIQGQDLYGTDVGERLRQALGFQSKYELGESAPGWLCGGSLHTGLGPVTEVGYNALHNRLGIAMTNTERLTERNRPAGSNNLFVAWETLTHGDNPN